MHYNKAQAIIINMTNKKSDYEIFLDSFHEGLSTNDDIIKALVKEGTDQDIISKRKIIAGEVNEVYDIQLSNNNYVILRISRREEPDFLQEQWAIEQAKKVGVPVPEILLIKHFEIQKKLFSFCLMNKINGEPLERGNLNFNLLTKEQKKQYIVRAGELLSKIHSIKTSGYGSIQPNGKTTSDTADDIIDEVLDLKERIYAIAKRENFDEKNIEQAMNIIRNFRNSYNQIATCLNHGDYSHKHFMAENNKIVAILDWGSVRSDTPVYDFASWDYWFGDYIPTDWLKEGYQNKKLFDKNFEEILHVLRIIKGLEVIDWYDLQKYQKAVTEAFNKLANDLNYFK